MFITKKGLSEKLDSMKNTTFDSSSLTTEDSSEVAISFDVLVE